MLIDPFVMFHTGPLSSVFFNEAYDEGQFVQSLLKFSSIINPYYVYVALTHRASEVLQQRQERISILRSVYPFKDIFTCNLIPFEAEQLPQSLKIGG